ncbi:tellurite resistance protein TehB [Corynebacterium occultum]|uniref:Tellurite resistance protein TehB n=1 Tax=Corynebacterium occultum TaxID=2675219 RepID=A0A6B8VSP9_9CORY|nr:class I SAM-dependent methyltransferase [Corynebacterium occultum]QGU07183.1 tellurite resistance protein TehB [Corynebacterium occultum]
MTTHQDRHHEHHNTHSRQDAEGFYAGTEPRWSGEPNQALVRELSDLAPGRCLDIGCGEGADLLWLARQGWEALGIDFAPTAVARTQALIDAAKSEDTNLRAEAREAAFPGLGETDFDLITASYTQIPRSAEAVAELRGSLKVGGTLFMVHHVFGQTEAAQAEGIILPEWLASQLGDDFRVLKLELSSRDIATGAGAHHHDDLVLVAVREH